MTEYRGITYRLLPCTVAKAKQLSATAGACRWVWNHFLRKNEQEHRFDRCFEETYGIQPTSSRNSTSFFAMGKEFTQLRACTPWLQELSFREVRYALKHQADAWTACFKGEKSRPRFKRKGRNDDGFTIPSNVKIQNDRLWVPKIGWCVLRRRGGNPYPDGLPKQATVKRVDGKWHCSVLYEVELDEKTDDGTAIGVDRNVRQVAFSTGHIVRLPDVSRLEARRKRYQRMMVRRQKGSNGRQKARYLMARTNRRIAKVRQDWCHQTNRLLADNASEIILEDLNTQGMTASAKGTEERPGKNVKAKAGLNRSILESGWHQLERYLGYKAFEVNKVPGMYTSQTCHRCGRIDKENRPSQSVFSCSGCGHTDNADVNAALNILASGTGASGRRGAFSLETPRTRQMDTWNVAKAA